MAEKTLKELTEALTLRDELLLESEKLFRTIFNCSPLAKCITDFETSIVMDVNVAFCETGGWKKEELVGKTFVEAGLFSLDVRKRVYAELTSKGFIKNMELNISTPAMGNVDVILFSKIVMINKSKKILSNIILKDEVCKVC